MNKKLTKFISLLFCILMMFCVTPFGVFGENSGEIYEKQNTNVALNKTVYYGNPIHKVKSQILTDGSTSVFIHPDSGAAGAYEGTVPLPSGATVNAATGQWDDWFMVDLGKKYLINKVRLVGRDASHYRFMQFFDIEASNVEDFSEFVKLGGRGSTTVAVSEYETSGDGNYYRYVRIRKTDSSEYGYREIQVFADVMVKEDESGNEVILPEVLTAKQTGDKEITVSFDSKMDASSFGGENIYIADKMENIYSPVSTELQDSENWDGGYEAICTFAENIPSGQLKLTVGENVKTADEKAFSRDVTVYVEKEYIAINKSYKALKSDVNVALGKTVYSGREGASGALLTNGLASNDFLTASKSSYPSTATNITLPSGDVVKGATGLANDWYIVDLGRRYNVEKVRLYYTTKNGSSLSRYIDNVKILVSDTITFDEAVTIGNIGGTVPESVNSTTPYYEMLLDGTKAYRYIKIQKTAESEYGYKELTVYADTMTTEVSRKAAAEAGKYNKSYPPAQAVDGTISGSNGWGQTGAPGSSYVPYSLLIDLGKNYPIGMVEVFGRKGYTTVYGRNLKGYGYSESAGKPELIGTPQNPTCHLFTEGTTGIDATAGERYSTNVADYRYIVISKTTNEVVWLSEVRALVLNPEVLGVKVNDDDTITVSFNDKMDIASLKAYNFTIKGVELSNPKVETGWDKGYDVTFDYSGVIADGMTLTVKNTVANEHGIEMAQDASVTIETDIFKVSAQGEKVDKVIANASHDVQAKYYSKNGATVIMYVAVKNANGDLISCVKSDKTVIAADGAAEITVENVVPKEGEKICIYLWEDITQKAVTGNVTMN